MNLLPPLCACAVCLMIGKGNQAYSDSPLESPACIDQYKQPSATIRELSGSLKDMRLKSFYNGARKHTLTFSLTTQDNIDTVLKEKIWHCYLVASAPLFTYKTYREIEPDVDMGDDRADIHHKSRVCLLMEKYIGLVWKTNKIKEPVKNQIIRHLFLPYYARILKQYKNAQELNPYRRDAQGNPVPPLSDKEKEFRKREIERIKRLPVQEVLKLMREGSSHRSFIETRNEVFGDEVKHLEKALMKLLVSEFPGQYGKVENFILEAGYSKEDIPGLIDRTVGRDEKTDFLYKGKHRQKHDKLYREKK